jgi:hypothetical protein
MLAWQLRPGSHALAQAPQFCESLVRSTQLVPHSVLPLAQPQTPFVHVSPPPQACPHPPQWLGLVLTSTQLPLQLCCPL